MTSMKRPLEEISQGPTEGLSKTERRRLAKKAKKERQGKGKGGAAAAAATPSRKGKKGPKPKMTKEERRAKYTQKAYEARERQNQMGPGANKTRCLGCRAWGHIVANCPEAKAATGICFNCGSSKHALRVCPKPRREDGSLPHAKCFVCKEKGHISAHCKQNANGVYPKGGFCKGCGSKHHLSWDCPDSTKVDKKKFNSKKGVSVPAGVDETSRDGESPPPSSSPAEPSGDAGEETTGAARSDRRRGAAAVGSAVGAEGQSKAKQRNSKKAPVQRVGGDDLEDDDYYDPEDVPGVPFEADAAAEEHFGSLAGGPSAAKGRGGPSAAGSASANAKKKSKVVVF